VKEGNAGDKLKNCNPSREYRKGIYTERYTIEFKKEGFILKEKQYT
jgi:hypothetical protein